MWKGNEQKHKHRWGLKGYTTEIQPPFKFRTSLAYTHCQSRSAPKLPGARATTSTKGVEIEGRRKTVESELPLNKRQTGLTHTQDTTQRSQSRGGILKKNIKLKVSNAGLRSVDYKGGIDFYLKDVKSFKLSPKAKKLKNKITAKA